MFVSLAQETIAFVSMELMFISSLQEETEMFISLIQENYHVYFIRTNVYFITASNCKLFIFQALVKNYDQDMETLTKQQKQQVEKAESSQAFDLKTAAKRIKIEQVMCNTQIIRARGGGSMLLIVLMKNVLDFVKREKMSTSFFVCILLYLQELTSAVESNIGMACPLYLFFFEWI